MLEVDTPCPACLDKPHMTVLAIPCRTMPAAPNDSRLVLPRLPYLSTPRLISPSRAAPLLPSQDSPRLTRSCCPCLACHVSCSPDSSSHVLTAMPHRILPCQSPPRLPCPVKCGRVSPRLVMPALTGSHDAQPSTVSPSLAVSGSLRRRLDRSLHADNLLQQAVNLYAHTQWFGEVARAPDMSRRHFQRIDQRRTRLLWIFA